MKQILREEAKRDMKSCEGVETCTMRFSILDVVFDYVEELEATMIGIKAKLDKYESILADKDIVLEVH